MKDYGKQIIVSVIAAILVFGVGYALLSDTITVTGTATTTGSLNVYIDSAAVNTSTGAADNTASISSDKNLVTLAVPKLEYPGASVTFNVALKNSGTVNAILKEITPTGLGVDGTDALIVTYTGLTKNSTVVSANDASAVNFQVTVTWDADATEGFTAQAFSIVLDFEQNI